MPHALPILSCDDCGLCCHTQSSPPFMPTELDALPPHLLAQLPDPDAPPLAKGPCLWLTADQRCRHYHHRPEACRQFQMGDEDCLAIRRLAGRDAPPVRN